MTPLMRRQMFWRTSSSRIRGRWTGFASIPRAERRIVSPPQDGPSVSANESRGSLALLVDRVTQALCSAAGELCFAPAFTRRRGRARRHAAFRGLDRPPNEIDQSLIRIRAIALLGAETPRHDDNSSVCRHAPPGERTQSRLHWCIKARRASRVKAQLNRCGDLVDV